MWRIHKKRDIFNYTRIGRIKQKKGRAIADSAFPQILTSLFHKFLPETSETKSCATNYEKGRAYWFRDYW